ncbi:MAG: hypothetical protein WBL45_06790 [Solirubrobacterales bacterium]
MQPAQAVKRIATAARTGAAAAKSFFAAPGSRTTSVWHSNTIAAASTVKDPRPYGLPMHHAAKNAIPNHPKLRNKDNVSRSVNTIPTAWSSSEFCG